MDSFSPILLSSLQPERKNPGSLSLLCYCHLWHNIPCAVLKVVGRFLTVGISCLFTTVPVAHTYCPVHWSLTANMLHCTLGFCLQFFQKLPQIAVYLLPTVSKRSVTVQLLACGIVTETNLGKDFQMKFFGIQAMTSQEKNNNRLLEEFRLQGH